MCSIGSDEDTGGSDESVCLDDPSDTAVSHSAAVERGHSHASDAASVAADAGYCWVVDNLPEVNGMLAEKGKDAQEADCVLDYGGNCCFYILFIIAVIIFTSVGI